MMNFLSDLWFQLYVFIEELPVFAIKAIVLYFVIKFAVKKALQEHKK